MTASLPVGVFETDTDFRLLAANDAFRDLALGGGSVVQGTAPWSHAVPHVRTECERAWLAHSGDPASFTCEFPVPSPDGSTVWVRLNSAARLDGGRIIGWVGSAVDVTPVVEQSSLSDQLVGLLDVSGDAVVVFDRVGSLTFANDTARSLLGVDPTRTVADDIAARTYMQAVRDQLPRFMLETGAAATNRWEGEIAFRSPDGLPRTLTVIVQVVRESDGTVHHWATIARDITEERQARAELDRLATHDALTGLPNRVLFLRKTTEALERAGTTGANVAVLFIDLDKLKHVNDTIGHAVGDQLIVSIARRLASATRPSDTVARISGDEFVVLCEGVLDEHVALDVAERVRTSITGQVVLQGIEIETGASIGVALATDDLLTGRSAADAAVTLLHAADTAMYKAKQRGRGRSELYSEQMRAAARERVQLSAELERALAGGELDLVYQPIELAHAGRVSAVEAFLRWNHPVRGQLSPASFLELADESGLIGPIGDWVLDRACRDIGAWAAAGLVDPAVSLHVNVSRRQLADTSFVDRTVATLRANGMDGARLVCETGEATLVDANPAILRTVNALKRAGVRIAVDDFGSGYSSLASLRTFPADILKIDGTLVRDVGRVDGGDDPMVRSIIQLAHSLELSVCAEWVTSDDQLQRLRVLGCDLVQGNRIGAAATADEFARRMGVRRSGEVPSGPGN
ncbi:MAG: bifunctional diguanylate cyclase/phosphodiesterase [Actinobacteria bacterium]|nr:bifunctional diguanylate cyclase/phosphodiesterase [Actinomycetota bacterium]